jgi:hypothetical protein
MFKPAVSFEKDGPRVLAHVAKILEKPGCWTKGAYARDVHGTTVKIGDPSACQFCLMGAVYLALRELDISQRNEGASMLIHDIRTRLSSPSKGLMVADFNDAPETTHQDVMNLLAEAREKVNAELS